MFSAQRLNLPLSHSLYSWWFSGKWFTFVAYLTYTSVQPFMAADTRALVVDLNYAIGTADIHFLPGICVWNRIVLLVKGDVVVHLNRCHLPRCILVVVPPAMAS